MSWPGGTFLFWPRGANSFVLVRGELSCSGPGGNFHVRIWAALPHPGLVDSRAFAWGALSCTLKQLWSRAGWTHTISLGGHVCTCSHCNQQTTHAHAHGSASDCTFTLLCQMVFCCRSAFPHRKYPVRVPCGYPREFTQITDGMPKFRFARCAMLTV